MSEKWDVTIFCLDGIDMRDEKWNVTIFYLNGINMIDELDRVHLGHNGKSW